MEVGGRLTAMHRGLDHGGLHGDEDGRHRAERPCGRLRPRAGTGIGVVVASWGRQTTTGGT